MSTTDSKLLKAEDVWGLEFDNPTELVKGELVEMTRPGTRHGIVCAEVTRIIGNWRAKTRKGRVVGNDSGVITERDPDTLRGPDLYYVSNERLPDGKVPVGWIEVPPDLCAEVLSPNDRWQDVLAKVHEYLALGVGEVWVIDPEEQKVHVYQREKAPAILSQENELTSSVLPGFACRVSDFFTEC